MIVIAETKQYVPKAVKEQFHHFLRLVAVVACYWNILDKNGSTEV